jgi:hypothetical protein
MAASVGSTARAPFSDSFIVTLRVWRRSLREVFDLLLTIDSRMEFQQIIPKFQIGVVVVHVQKNQLARYKVLQKELLLAVEQVQRGQVIHVRARPIGSV